MTDADPDPAQYSALTCDGYGMLIDSASGFHDILPATALDSVVAQPTWTYSSMAELPL
jgi:hypothetical protein